MEGILADMDKKIKFIFLGLIGLLAASMLFLFSVMGSRQALLRDYQATRESFTRESEALARKASMALDEKRTIENRLSALQRDYDKINQEKTELEEKYERVNKERLSLLDRLKHRPPAAEERIVERPVVDDAYWAGILKEKTALEIQVGSLREQLKSIQISAEELKREKATQELEMSNIIRDKKELETRILYHEQVADSLSAELVREKKDKRQILAELGAIKREQAMLLRQVRTLNNQRASLETRLKQAEEARLSLEKRIANINEMLEYKLSEVGDLRKELSQIQEGAEIISTTKKGSIELPAIIVRSAPETAAVRPLTPTGKVLAVNRENNFIIIDLGEEDGIKSGVNFDVYRNNKKIANVEVIQTRRNVSACDIKQSFAPINLGDEIR